MVDQQCNPFLEIRKADPDHALLIALAPKAVQQALASLHAFCIELARISSHVTEPQAGLIRHQWWRDQITSLYEQSDTTETVQNHPLLPLLDAVITDFAIPRALIMSFIDARGAALVGWRPNSMTDLTKQARAMYGTQMAIWGHLLGVEARAVEAQAIAFTLIAHVRAAPWDQQDNICTIPKAILSRYDLHPEQFHSTPPEKLIPAWEALTTQANNLLIGTPPCTHKVFRAHRKLCHLYLNALQKADYNPYMLRDVPFKALRLLMA